MYGFVAYCDGASRKDGRGGWGAAIVPSSGRTSEIYGGKFNTTNNRMELRAVIEALWYIAPGSEILVVCDSQYVVKGATEYIETWQRAGWRTSQNKPLRNVDLWIELLNATGYHTRVDYQWVKGHSGDSGNERADALALQGVESLQSISTPAAK